MYPRYLFQKPIPTTLVKTSRNNQPKLRSELWWANIHRGYNEVRPGLGTKLVTRSQVEHVQSTAQRSLMNIYSKFLIRAFSRYSYDIFFGKAYRTSMSRSMPTFWRVKTLHIRKRLAHQHQTVQGITWWPTVPKIPHTSITKTENQKKINFRSSGVGVFTTSSNPG